MPDSYIRVLQVIGSAHAGGVETFVLELARNIDRRFQLNVCILGSDGPMVEALRDTGVAVHVLGARRPYWQRALKYLWYAWAGRFEIVHVNIGGRLPRYLALCARCGSLISHIPGPTGDEVEAWRQGDPSASPSILRNYVRGARYVVVSSHEIARMLTACCPGITDRLKVISYGVDLDRFRPVTSDWSGLKATRSELGLSETEVLVGFVGRLVPQKGLSYLIAAAKLLQARYDNLRFIVIGDGPLKSELMRAAAFSGNRFYFLGERHDVPRLLGLFDMLVVPSEWEPFGIVNLEAMAAAKPVVAFDVDGIPEIVVHGETGLLVPHRDDGALASAIAQLLDDPQLRQRMGAAGRQRVQQRFNIQNTTRAFKSLYEAALKR